MENSQHSTHSGGGKAAAAARDVLTRALPIDDERVDALAERARELDQRARTYIREHPTTTVLAAVALGFVLGRLLRS